MTTSEQIEMVMNGSADMAASWITINKERSTNVSFTFPYYDLWVAFVYKPEAEQVMIHSTALFFVALHDFAAVSVKSRSVSPKKHRGRNDLHAQVSPSLLFRTVHIRRTTGHHEYDFSRKGKS